MVRGPACCYFLDPTNSILVVSKENVQRDQIFFRGIGLKVLMGSCYLGGFIGDG